MNVANISVNKIGMTNVSGFNNTATGVAIVVVDAVAPILFAVAAAAAFVVGFVFVVAVVAATAATAVVGFVWENDNTQGLLQF